MSGTVILGPKQATLPLAATGDAGVTSLRAENAGVKLTGDVILKPGQHVGIAQDETQRKLTVSVMDLPATIVSALNGLDGNVTLIGQGLVITKDAATRRITIAFDPSGVVQSVNGLSGTVSLVAGENVQMRVLGNNELEISASGGGGGSGGAYGYGVADRATFSAGMGRPILVGADFGARHIVIRPSRPGALFAHLASPQASGDFIFDVLRSIDSGETWVSVLATPVVIPPGFNGVVAFSQFTAGSQLAPGNLLRIDVISAGNGPGYASGLMCSIRLDGDSVPGWDRATILFGLSEQPQPGIDYGVRYIATRRTTPAMIYAMVRQPPIGTATEIDLQVWRAGSWHSLFPPGQPLSFAPNVESILTTDAVANIEILPGDLIRPIVLNAAVSSGLGFNIALEMEVQ
jgi:hypothetical protein